MNLLTLDLPDVNLYLGPFLAFARIAGMLHTMPIISTKVVPRQIRMILAVLLAFVIAPNLPPPPESATISLPFFGLALFAETCVGLAMGFAASMVTHVFEMAGTLVGFHSGFSNAVLFDPVTQSSSMLASRVFQIAGFLTLLSADIHHFMIVGLVDSFTAVPPGVGVVSPDAGMALSRRLGLLLVDANRIAMPVFAATLFLNIAWALVTRFAQQMNVYFAAGMGVNAVVGILVTGTCIPATILLVVDSGPAVQELMAAVLGRR